MRRQQGTSTRRNFSRVRRCGILLCFSFTSPAAASAEPPLPVSLSREWQMESDEQYSHDAEYQPPPAVRGIALHGYFAGEYFQLSNGMIKMAGDERCPEPVALADPRGLPNGFSPQTYSEFWFYRSGDQGLYLARSWKFQLSEQCKVTVFVNTRVVHSSLFNGRIRLISLEDGQTPDLQVEVAAEYRGYRESFPYEFIDDGELNTLNRNRTARRSDDRLGPGRSRRSCFDTSLAFHFSTICFLAEPGRWHGLRVWTHLEEDDGSGLFEYRITDLDPAARIEGRLFEWDRKIVLAR